LLVPLPGERERLDRAAGYQVAATDDYQRYHLRSNRTSDFKHLKSIWRRIAQGRRLSV